MCVTDVAHIGWQRMNLQLCSSSCSYLTSQSLTDVTVSQCDVTAPDVNASRSYDCWFTDADTQHTVTLDQYSTRTLDVMTSCMPDVTASESVRYLDDASDAISCQLTQLLSVNSPALYDVTQRHHGNMTPPESTQLLLTPDDSVETYYSSVDRERPASTEAFISQRQLHHHLHHHHHPQHGYCHHQQQNVSYSSSTTDVYSSLYSYSADERRPEIVIQTSPVTGAECDSVAHMSSSLSRLVPVHITRCSLTTDVAGPMLSFSHATTSSSLSSSSLLAECYGVVASDSGISGSFSALLHSSSVTHHVDVDVSATSTGHADQQWAERQVSDAMCAADVLDATLLPYDIVLSPACYNDDHAAAWHSPGIATLMKSFADTLTADYPGFQFYKACARLLTRPALL